MAFYEDDVAAMLEDFGVSVVLKPGLSDTSTVTAIFDKEQEIVNVQTGEIIGSSPALTCESADVSALVKGDSVTVGGTTYKIKGILNDGTGVTILQLTDHL